MVADVNVVCDRLIELDRKFERDKETLEERPSVVEIDPLFAVDVDTLTLAVGESDVESRLVSVADPDGEPVSDNDTRSDNVGLGVGERERVLDCVAGSVADTDGDRALVSVTEDDALAEVDSSPVTVIVLLRTVDQVLDGDTDRVVLFVAASVIDPDGDSERLIVDAWDSENVMKSVTVVLSVILAETELERA